MQNGGGNTFPLRALSSGAQGPKRLGPAEQAQRRLPGPGGVRVLSQAPRSLWIPEPETMALFHSCSSGWSLRGPWGSASSSGFSTRQGISWQEPLRYLSGPVGRDVGNTAIIAPQTMLVSCSVGWCWRKKKKNRLFQHILSDQRIVLYMYIMIFMGEGEGRKKQRNN